MDEVGRLTRGRSRRCQAVLRAIPTHSSVDKIKKTIHGVLVSHVGSSTDLSYRLGQILNAPPYYITPRQTIADQFSSRTLSTCIKLFIPYELDRCIDHNR